MSEPSVRVDRCVCYEVRFAELRALAEGLRARHGEEVTVDDLESRTGCGSGCGMCRIYIERMLETGETELPLMPQPERG